MSKPIVAIIGRPNVGKSTLFNAIVGKRVSIIEGSPGVTRDRIYAESEWRGVSFALIDTGGIEPYSKNVIMQQMKKQTQLAIDTADVIVFVVDVKDGVTATDSHVATMLRRTYKPIVVAVNKIDNTGSPPHEFYEFYNLGFHDIFPVSSSHKLGLGDLLDGIYDNFKDKTISQQAQDEDIKIAVVGRPNAGKSSLINKILGEERVLVSDVPGTTRDSIDTYFQREDKKYVLIDTAGIRRKSKIDDSIERYSVIRSWAAIERADVCLMVIDAKVGITEQDTKIAGYAHEQGKSSIIVLNKWDIIDKNDKTVNEYTKIIYEKLSFMTYAPVIFVSAKTGLRVSKIFDMVNQAVDYAEFRITTGVLNDFINEIIAIVPPPADRGKRPKIFYATQISVTPPTFVLFVNNPELMHFSYQRYIENQLRENFKFYANPIKILLRKRER